MTDHSQLVKRLRGLVIIDEVRSNNPLGREAADAIDTLQARVEALEARETEAQAILARIRKVRDGYADQAKFADVDPASYFREFVRRIDGAARTLLDKETPR